MSTAARTLYTVTMPDGTVATRNSVRPYTHVAVTFSGAWLPVRWSASEAAARAEAARWTDWAARDPGRQVTVLPCRCELSPAQAYMAGYSASRRTRTYNMEPGEARFDARWGRTLGLDWVRGWTDYACGWEAAPEGTRPQV